MNHKKTILILCTVFLIALLPLASAEVLRPDLVDMNKTISFADLGLSGPSEILIYSADPDDDYRSVLVETGNSTADYLYQPIGDYQIVQKPSLANRWLGNPMHFFQDLTGIILTNFMAIFMILGMTAIVIGLAQIGKRRS